MSSPYQHLSPFFPSSRAILLLKTASFQNQGRTNAVVAVTAQSQTPISFIWPSAAAGFRFTLLVICNVRHFCSAQAAQTDSGEAIKRALEAERDKSHSRINIQTLGIGCGALCKHSQLSSCDLDSFLGANKLECAGKPRLVQG